MMELTIFRNSSGELGLFQKEGNIVKYLIRTNNKLYSPSGENNWNAWVELIDSGNRSGDKEKTTKESIQFFLHSYAESISIEIIETHQVSRPGSYYPRIARENIEFDYVSEEFLHDVRAYQNIQISLDNLFNYIEPSTENLNAYGHKIRELLILACTEVEYLLLKTLTDNGYNEKKSYTTSDYIKCKDILKLDSFEVGLLQYPKLKRFKPFYGWNSEKPTQSLPWYCAYNSVKHNRNDSITHANLGHLLDAISAIHVLLESQYGRDIFHRWSSLTDDRSIFETKVAPKWMCSEITAPVLSGGYSINTIWIDKRKYFEDYP